MLNPTSALFSSSFAFGLTCLIDNCDTRFGFESTNWLFPSLFMVRRYVTSFWQWFIHIGETRMRSNIFRFSGTYVESCNRTMTVQSLNYHPFDYWMPLTLFSTFFEFVVNGAELRFGIKFGVSQHGRNLRHFDGVGNESHRLVRLLNHLQTLDMVSWPLLFPCIKSYRSALNLNSHLPPIQIQLALFFDSHQQYYDMSCAQGSVPNRYLNPTSIRADIIQSRHQFNRWHRKNGVKPVNCWP